MSLKDEMENLTLDLGDFIAMAIVVIIIIVWTILGGL